MTRFVAVLDIGKTNAKLVLHDLEEGCDLWEARRPNIVLSGPPYPHFDIKALWRFFLDALGQCAAGHAIEAISVTTHGACAALVDDRGLVLPVLDYESNAPDECAAEYDALRPPFRETFSPRLPGGLNLGAQFFWLQGRFPDAFAQARYILPYPQYWAWRLTGVAASEVTSLGCHTDLWEPAGGRFSSMAARTGWRERFAPVRPASAVLGPLRPEIADAAGLGGRTIPVHCGIHDSNASLLPHLRDRPAPFTVVSTGTWAVSLAIGGSLERLREKGDMLANVDAFGRPVPSARFMGGREFDLLTGHAARVPTDEETARVLGQRIRALPSFMPGTGPFPDRTGSWSHDPGKLSPGERTAAASLYVALMTVYCLKAMDADGPTLVEGPFARNALFLRTLERATGRAVVPSTNATGTSGGAARLAGDAALQTASTQAPRPEETADNDIDPQGLEAYIRGWNEEVGRQDSTGPFETALVSDAKTSS